MTSLSTTVENPNEPSVGSTARSSRLILLFSICFISSTFGGVVSSLMADYLPVAVKDLLGNVTESKLNDIGAFINAIFLFGWMFGGFIWGILCDRIGRSRAVMLSTCCYGLFTLLTSLAPSWPLVTICRFLSGFGVGGVLVTTTIIVSEAWTGKTREVALGILSMSIPIGIFSAGLTKYLVSGWRQAFLCGIIPLIAAGVTLLFLKEPEKREESKKMGNNNIWEHRHNLWVGSLIFGTMLIGMWTVFSWLPTWVQSVSGAAAAQHEIGTSMMLMGGGGLAGGFFSGWIIHHMGIRKTMLLCFSICFVLAFLLFRLNNSFSGAAYPEIAIMAIFFGISQGALSAYIPDLFPVAVRASATGFCFNIGRLFTTTSVFFAGAMVTMLGGYGNTLFIFSFIFLIGFLATWYVRDKK